MENLSPGATVRSYMTPRMYRTFFRRSSDAGESKAWRPDDQHVPALQSGRTVAPRASQPRACADTARGSECHGGCLSGLRAHDLDRSLVGGTTAGSGLLEVAGAS